jgi:hypothetical protein
MLVPAAISVSLHTLAGFLQNGERHRQRAAEPEQIVALFTPPLDSFQVHLVPDDGQIADGWFVMRLACAGGRSVLTDLVPTVL